MKKATINKINKFCARQKHRKHLGVVLTDGSLQKPAITNGHFAIFSNQLPDLFPACNKTGKNLSDALQDMLKQGRNNSKNNFNPIMLPLPKKDANQMIAFYNGTLQKLLFPDGVGSLYPVGELKEPEKTIGINAEYNNLLIELGVNEIVWNNNSKLMYAKGHDDIEIIEIIIMPAQF